MVFISIAGSIVAGIHYYAVDRPQQTVVPAQPLNVYNSCSDTVTRNIFCSCINNRYGQAGFPICMEGGQKAYGCTIDAMQLISMTCR